MRLSIHGLVQRFPRPDGGQATVLDRLDLETAGVMLFTVPLDARHPYQRLFAERRVHKVYEALVPWHEALPQVLRAPPHLPLLTPPRKPPTRLLPTLPRPLLTPPRVLPTPLKSPDQVTDRSDGCPVTGIR
jgi:hypothetical protein